MATRPDHNHTDPKTGEHDQGQEPQVQPKLQHRRSRSGVVTPFHRQDELAAPPADHPNASPHQQNSEHDHQCHKATARKADWASVWFRGVGDTNKYA